MNSIPGKYIKDENGQKFSPKITIIKNKLIEIVDIV